MRPKARKRAGFTLVELMVVALMVAVLAAVAIPLMSSNKKRAMATEAEAALGTIRSALRATYAQSSAYNVNLNGDAIAAGAVVGVVPGINAGDLDGRWFDDSAYSITAIGAATYTVAASGDSSTSSEAADVAGVNITLDQDGDFTRAGI